MITPPESCDWVAGREDRLPWCLPIPIRNLAGRTIDIVLGAKLQAVQLQSKGFRAQYRHERQDRTSILLAPWEPKMLRAAFDSWNNGHSRLR